MIGSTTHVARSVLRPGLAGLAAAISLAALGSACSPEDDGSGACNLRCDQGCRSSGLPGGYCVGTTCRCNPIGGDADADADGDWDGGDGCDERARWIYVVTEEKQMIRFYPDTGRLEPIGTLNCSPSATLATPFSMSVDRTATAWVLYNGGLMGRGGELFRVSTVDASCTSTTFVPNQDGFEVFGMGFSSDEPDSDFETLYVAGGAMAAIGTGSSTLGWINLTSLDLTPVDGLPGWPELTGTGLAELWGFFPDTTPPTVSRISKTDGTVDRTYDLTIDTANTEAWAFAFWGGDFYIFLKTLLDTSSNIWKLEADDGAVTEAVHDTGWTIVGAGVSTCAPVVIF